MDKRSLSNAKLMDKYFYPVTKETIHAYAESIFAPIRRGECVTTVWVPMAGRRMWNKFIIENIHLFEKELPNYQKYLLIYIEPLDLTEESLNGYLRLMARSFMEVWRSRKDSADLEKIFGILNDESVSYSKLLDAIRNLLSQVIDNGSEIIFFLGEFDEIDFATSVFYNNLKSLWGRLTPRLHYIFVMRERVTRAQNIAKWGELNEAILQNVLYIPLLKGRDVDYILERLSRIYSITLLPEEIKIIKKLCGSHPYMLKVVLRVYEKFRSERGGKGDLESFLLGYYELQSVARGILDVRSDNEKTVLKMIAQGKKVDGSSLDELVGFLEKLGLIVRDPGKEYRLFGKLFEDAVLGDGTPGKKILEEGNGVMTIDEATGQIFYNSQTVEERFTRQEYSILTMFLQNTNKLLTRDQIGEAIWGKDSYEKYSDWAIDQLVSKLRRKLSTLQIRDKLVTVRGKGYKLVSIQFNT